MTAVKFTILGQPVSKANSREIVRLNRRDPKTGVARETWASVKSPVALAYERDFIRQIPVAARAMITGPVKVSIFAYYASERSDLDTSIIRDAMQPRYSKLMGVRTLTQKGVYLNDRQVKEEHNFWRLDAKRPRAEIEVVQLVPHALELELREVADA